jgi:hypothetical protein
VPPAERSITKPGSSRPRRRQLASRRGAFSSTGGSRREGRVEAPDGYKRANHKYPIMRLRSAPDAPRYSTFGRHSASAASNSSRTRDPAREAPRSRGPQSLRQIRSRPEPRPSALAPMDPGRTALRTVRVRPRPIPSCRAPRPRSAGSLHSPNRRSAEPRENASQPDSSIDIRSTSGGNSCYAFSSHPMEAPHSAARG